jgi:cytoskeletal protein CcmA (bactofilin family)
VKRGSGGWELPEDIRVGLFGGSIEGVIIGDSGCCSSPKVIVIREVEIETFTAGFRALLRSMVVLW